MAVDWRAALKRDVQTLVLTPQLILHVVVFPLRPARIRGWRVIDWHIRTPEGGGVVIDYLRVYWHQWVLCHMALHDYDGDIRQRLNPRAIFEACLWCDRRRLLPYRKEGS